MSIENEIWKTSRDNGIDFGTQICRIVWNDDTGTDVAYVVDRADDDNGNKVAKAIAAIPRLLVAVRAALQELPPDHPEFGVIRSRLAIALTLATGETSHHGPPLTDEQIEDAVSPADPHNASPSPLFNHLKNVGSQ